MKPNLGIVYDLPLVLPLFYGFDWPLVPLPQQIASSVYIWSLLYSLYSMEIQWRNLQYFTILHNQYIILHILYLKIIIPPGKFP